MKKLIVKLSTGYAGMDTYEALTIDDDATEYQISEMIWQMVIQYAETYSIYLADDFSESELQDDTADSYSDNIEGYVIREYDPEKHDMYHSGNGSFEQDFKWQS